MSQAVPHLRFCWLCLAVTLALQSDGASAAPPEVRKPSIKKIAANGRATLDRLNRDTASWTTVFDTSTPETTIQVTITSSPKMRSIVFELGQGRKLDQLLRIVERDGFWYVTDENRSGKFRPYEAPLELPIFYKYLASAELEAIIEDTALGAFQSLQANVADYRSPLSDEMKRKVEHALRAFEFDAEGEQTQPGSEAHALVPLLEDLRDHGIITQIDIDHGIVVSGGALANRYTVRNFQWLSEGKHERFVIDESKYSDHTANLVDTARRLDELMMIAQADAWVPGLPVPEIDVKLVNMRTAEMRRVPFPHGITLGGCFAKDRRSVFLCGHMTNEGSFGLFQIELSTGAVRQLGKNLEVGIAMFPCVSPNGKTLAVAGNLGSYENVLASQIYLIDIATGNAQPLGQPLDTAHLSWLPDGSGLVLITRAYPDLDKPSIDTIARMDLKGSVTTIRKGSMPVVLTPYRRIAYQDDDDGRWKVCDLNGKELTVIGDGLNGGIFPTVSPEGKRLIIMRVVAQKGQIPHLVDIANGTATPLELGTGFWMYPAWR